jgi:hypothetical protein
VLDAFGEKAAAIRKLADSGVVAEEVCDKIEAELEKVRTLDPSSSDYNITKNYLNHLTDFPWSETNEEKHDVTFANEVLDREHYGLDEVKNAILQFVAVGNLNSTSSEEKPPGKIICLVGPPGVGKVRSASEAKAKRERRRCSSCGGQARRSGETPPSPPPRPPLPDEHRQEHRGVARPRVLPLLGRRPVRRERDQGAPADVRDQACQCDPHSPQRAPLTRRS